MNGYRDGYRDSYGGPYGGDNRDGYRDGYGAPTGYGGEYRDSGMDRNGYGGPQRNGFNGGPAGLELQREDMYRRPEPFSYTQGEPFIPGYESHGDSICSIGTADADCSLEQSGRVALPDFDFRIASCKLTVIRDWATTVEMHHSIDSQAVCG
ncbi:hypothetical protein LSAT2_020698 [Lamellibrachia satsuma]|nr:hypothetical protein LSAT2_020698 [Lamellibrachia satsuma]